MSACVPQCVTKPWLRGHSEIVRMKGVGKEAKTWLKWMRISGRRFFSDDGFCVGVVVACLFLLVKLVVPNCTRDVTLNYLTRRERVDVVRFPRNL